MSLHNDALLRIAQLFILDPSWSVALFFPVALLFVWVMVTVVRCVTVKRRPAL